MHAQQTDNDMHVPAVQIAERSLAVDASQGMGLMRVLWGNTSVTSSRPESCRASCCPAMQHDDRSAGRQGSSFGSHEGEVQSIVLQGFACLPPSQYRTGIEHSSGHHTALSHCAQLAGCSTAHAVQRRTAHRPAHRRGGCVLCALLPVALTPRVRELHVHRPGCPACRGPPPPPARPCRPGPAPAAPVAYMFDVT